MSAPDGPRPLRVALLAEDAGRRALLSMLIESAGHVLADRTEDAAVVLADLAPGERAGDDCGPAWVVLSDVPALAREPGIRAVLPRSASPAQIDAALRAAASGLFVRIDDPSAAGFRQAEDRTAEDRAAEDRAAEGGGPTLTAREMEILAAIGTGLSNKEVARLLGISAHTVKFHLEATFGKLGANTRAEAVAKGLRRGLIEV